MSPGGTGGRKGCRPVVRAAVRVAIRRKGCRKVVWAAVKVVIKVTILLGTYGTPENCIFGSAGVN